jgi:hypothetical protein
MKSLSNEDLSDIGKWPWSIVPSRAFGDKRLKDADRRVLGALCAFVNRAGVCWPALATIKDISGHATNKSVFDAIQRLKEAKYVRQLRPKDYQETRSGWKSNRYQVLWLGDEPRPTMEDINTARKLQLASDDEPIKEEIGGAGDETALNTLSHTLAHAYARAVQSRTGQVRNVASEINHARRLALVGISIEQVREATVQACDQALARRAGVPSLADVARLIVIIRGVQ